MKKAPKTDPKLQARVALLKKRAQAMVKAKEAPFMNVIEGWLNDASSTDKKKRS